MIRQTYYTKTMTKILTSFILLLLFISSANAQNKALKTLEEAKDLSKKVAILFKQKDISKAFKELRPYWPIPENEVDAIEEKTLKYLNVLEDRFGNSIETIKVKEEKIGDFAVRETYLVRYNISAIRLIFTYYMNSEGWIINAFKWDDSFDEEFR